MAVVRTKLAPGNHVVRGKKVNLTPQRFKSWADKFQTLKAQGESFGVPWGHFQDAGPSAKQFLASHFNAGYINDISVDADNKLNLVLDCPGLSQGPNGTLLGKAELADGSKVETVIKEVSPGIWDSWTDGKGNKHTDLVGHVALTMKPIVAGQSGFEAFSAELPDSVMYFASDFGKDDEKKKESSDETEKLGDDIEKTAKKDDADSDEEDLDSLLNVGTEGAGNSEQERLTRIMALMAEGGIVLPPDTDCDNFNERLETALGVMLAAQRVKAAEKAKEEADAAAAAPGPVTEQGGPATNMMMSTLIKENATVRNLMQSHLAKVRETRATRIAALKKRGLKDVIAEKLSTAKLFLSTIVDDSGALTDDETDRTLTILEATLPTEEFAATYLSTIAPLSVSDIAPPINDAANEPTEKVGNLTVTKAEKTAIEARNARAGGKV